MRCDEGRSSPRNRSSGAVRVPVSETPGHRGDTARQFFSTPPVARALRDRNAGKPNGRRSHRGSMVSSALNCGSTSDAEEIQRQHSHLTLAQIYAALTYYHDHRQHFDSEIRDQLRDVDLIASRQEPSPVTDSSFPALAESNAPGFLAPLLPGRCP